MIRFTHSSGAAAARCTSSTDPSHDQTFDSEQSTGLFDALPRVSASTSPSISAQFSLHAPVEITTSIRRRGRPMRAQPLLDAPHGATDAPSDMASTFESLPHLPLHLKLPPSDDVWTHNPGACGFHAKQARQLIRDLSKGEKADAAIALIHTWMSHLAATIEPEYNAALCRALALCPAGHRMLLAEGLAEIFASPGATKGSVRFAIANSLTLRSRVHLERVLDAIKHFAPIADGDMLLAICEVWTCIPHDHIDAFLNVLKPYLAIDDSSTWATTTLLFQLCAERTPNDLAKICAFICRSHNVAAPDLLRVDADHIKLAASIRDVDMAEFEQIHAMLDQMTQFLTPDLSQARIASPFFACLALIAPTLRAPIGKAVLQLYTDLAPEARIPQIIQLLNDVAANEMQAFIHESAIHITLAQELESVYGEILHALACVPSNRRLVTIKVAQVLLPFETDTPQATAQRRVVFLQCASRLSLRRKTFSIKSGQELAEQCALIFAGCRDSDKMMEAFFLLLRAPSEERIPVATFVLSLTAESLSTQARLQLLATAIALKRNGRNYMLETMKPYAFGPEHDKETSFQLFCGVYHLYKQHEDEDIAGQMQQWAFQSPISDFAPCVASHVTFAIHNHIQVLHGLMTPHSSRTPESRSSFALSAASEHTAQALPWVPVPPPNAPVLNGATDVLAAEFLTQALAHYSPDLSYLAPGQDPVSETFARIVRDAHTMLAPRPDVIELATHMLRDAFGRIYDWEPPTHITIAH